ncbi:MAG: hypothetical protein MZU97_00875 [Bacillus subtilis]|nr:hypothetical protein [Bacillus subtilis]
MKIQEVEALKQALINKKTATSEATLRQWCDEFDKRYIYESTSFDNGNFSYEDVCFLLEDHSRLFPDKDEHVRKAIINNYHAISAVHKLSKDGEPINENIVKDLHSILVDGLLTGGLYRTRDLFILGAKHVPPSYLKIYTKMENYFYELNRNRTYGHSKSRVRASRNLENLSIYGCERPLSPACFSTTSSNSKVSFRSRLPKVCATNTSKTSTSTKSTRTSFRSQSFSRHSNLNGFKNLLSRDDSTLFFSYVL